MSTFIKPTDSELEILQVLWANPGCTVRDVHEALNKKDAGYTTTLKLMQIMHEKGLVDRDTSAKTHVYTAKVDQAKTQEFLLKKMINDVFNGSTSRLVMQALGDKKSSTEEIELIKKYLNNLK